MTSHTVVWGPSCDFDCAFALAMWLLSERGVSALI